MCTHTHTHKVEGDHCILYTPLPHSHIDAELGKHSVLIREVVFTQSALYREVPLYHTG